MGGPGERGSGVPVSVSQRGTPLPLSFHLRGSLDSIRERISLGTTASERFLKKVERSAADLPTACFRIGVEPNDLPEVTGAAEWRFREQQHENRCAEPKPNTA